MKTSVLSENKVKGYTNFAGITLEQVNAEAGFGPNYIYRLYGRDNIQLSTINRIVAVLRNHGVDVSTSDLLEEVHVPDTQSKAPAVA